MATSVSCAMPLGANGQTASTKNSKPPIVSSILESHIENNGKRRGGGRYGSAGEYGLTTMCELQHRDGISCDTFGGYIAATMGVCSNRTVE